MYKQPLTFFAILAFIVGLVFTGIGGYSDMIGKPLLLTKQHAWNDGIVMILVAIFLLLLAHI